MVYDRAAEIRQWEIEAYQETIGGLEGVIEHMEYQLKRIDNYQFERAKAQLEVLLLDLKISLRGIE